MQLYDDPGEIAALQREYALLHVPGSIMGPNFKAPARPGGVRGSTAQEAEAANLRQVGGDHYKTMGIEPWDVVDTWPLEQRIGAYRHGALKYLMRMGSKDESPQEIAKGQHYMQKLLEVLNENKEV